jgi:hypothetical protein
MLIAPLNTFPWALNGLTEAWVSLKRIQKLIFVSPRTSFMNALTSELARSECKRATFGAHKRERRVFERYLQHSQQERSKSTCDSFRLNIFLNLCLIKFCLFKQKYVNRNYF